MEKKKQHILFLSSWFPTSQSPFNGNFVIRHAEAVALYSKVSFINVTTDSLLDKGQLEIAPNIHFYEHSIKLPWRIPVLSLMLTLLLKFYHYWKLYRIVSLTEGKPDIIHTNVIFPGALYAWFLKLITGIPFIVSEHWTGFLPDKKVKIQPIKLLLIKYLCKKASVICPVSNYLKCSMLDKGIKGNYKIVPNVVNTQLFMIHEKKKKEEKYQFLHISSLIDEHKNISGLINVIQLLSKKLNNFKLHIITCEQSHDWEKRVEKLKLSEFIEFHYSYSPTQIADFFGTIDAFVLFSNYETFGVVVIESFASGVPVISTNIKPIDELVTNERGFLTEVGNEQELVKVLEGFINGDRQFEKRKIHEFATKNFSYESVGQQFLNIYNEISRNNRTNS